LPGRGFADVLDAMGRPKATTIKDIKGAIERDTGNFADGGGFYTFFTDRKNRRVIPHRLEKCGYVSVRNDTAKDGLWVIDGARQVNYADAKLLAREQHAAAVKLQKNGK
jgi:hypothetical protein